MSEEQPSESSDNLEAPDNAEYDDAYFKQYLTDKIKKLNESFSKDEPTRKKQRSEPLLRYGCVYDKKNRRWVIRNDFYSTEMPYEMTPPESEPDMKAIKNPFKYKASDGLEYMWDPDVKTWLPIMTPEYPNEETATSSGASTSQAASSSQDASTSSDVPKIEDENTDDDSPAEQNSSTEGTKTATTAAECVNYGDTVSSVYTAPDGKIYVLNKETNTWEANDGEELENEEEDELKKEEKEQLEGEQLGGKKLEGEQSPYEYTAPDGTVYEWDHAQRGWFPKIDDDFLARYHASYGNYTEAPPEEIKSTQPAKVEQLPTVPEPAPSFALPNPPPPDPRETKAELEQQRLPAWFVEDPLTTTKVYIQNLPDDMTEEEFVELMSKYGIIAKDHKSKKLKVKLYAEPSGQLKGDALCTYARVESVQMAIEFLDEADYRGRKLKVERAKFEMRGSYNPTLKPKKSKKEKQKEKKQLEKMFEWHPEKMRGEREKHEGTVIFKNLFDPAVFAKNVSLILDYQQDLQEECMKYGTCKKVVVFSTEPDGIAKVVMSDPIEADTVISVFNGRIYKGRTVTAETWDGRTKYKKNESDSEVAARLEQWKEFLADEDGGGDSD